VLRQRDCNQLSDRQHGRGAAPVRRQCGSGTVAVPLWCRDSAVPVYQNSIKSTTRRAVTVGNVTTWENHRSIVRSKFWPATAPPKNNRAGIAYM